MNDFDTICALATPYGKSAIAVIRLSGQNSIEIANKIFFNTKGEKVLDNPKANKAYFGRVIFQEELIDECIITVFKSPFSYTGEDSVEVSLHGSKYIIDKTLNALIANGARMATEGEFTKRAFLNGKLDLSQAEAVADIINSNSEKAHDLAFKQLRGGYSQTLKELRTRLLNLSSLLELELDFSEEDVEFADREEFKTALNNIKSEVKNLIDSFALGNAFKNGIPISIIGKPNVGKSTLLNVLLNEERAIVSDIAGTTRDTIEENIIIKGIEFRFIDTAGIRHSNDSIEAKGIERTYLSANQSKIILYLIDITNTNLQDINKELEDLEKNVSLQDKELILIINKSDIETNDKDFQNNIHGYKPIFISAKKRENIDELVNKMLELSHIGDISNKVMLTNQRHYQEMLRIFETIEIIEKAFENNLPSDLIAIDLNTALYHIGTITGEVTNEEVLHNIFSQFCIGK